MLFNWGSRSLIDEFEKRATDQNTVSLWMRWKNGGGCSGQQQLPARNLVLITLGACTAIPGQRSRCGPTPSYCDRDCSSSAHTISSTYTRQGPNSLIHYCAMRCCRSILLCLCDSARIRTCRTSHVYSITDTWSKLYRSLYSL